MPYPTLTLGAIAYSGIDKPKAFVDAISFHRKSEIKLTDNQIVVFVGPNNVGKSIALREIYNHVGQLSPNKIVRAISLVKKGTDGDLEKYVKSKYKYSNQYPASIELPDGALFNNDVLKTDWVGSPGSLKGLASIFTLFLSTEERLLISKTAESIPLLTANPSHPSHHILLDDKLEKTFSEYFKRAFNLELIVNRGAGQTVPLHVGTSPEFQPGEDRVSKSYLERLSKLPILEQQGDGIRSFVGVFLSAFVSDQTMLFIDEPEAFLHPPQALIMGQMLANDLPPDKQLFLSTHSEDLLKGLIDKNSDRVKVIRINRQGDKNDFNELDSDSIKTLWADPLLKYSNILSGLFHSKVIVCESDGDCRFFAAMIDAVTEKENLNKQDILFVHCGGKHRIPTVVNALVKVGVKVCVVADFDVFREKSPLKDIYEGLGGDWKDIEEKWKRIKAAIEEKKPPLETDEIRNKITQILQQVNDPVFPQHSVIEIKKLLNKASAWSQAKEQGKSYVPAGNSTKYFNEIIDQLKAKRINVIEIGELECFYRPIGNHGPKWVNEVLQKDLQNDYELNYARQFVKELVDQ
ncbi:hypothetical protein GCM10028805_60260 [Spirosoma harenae]